ncbi:transcriptional antiterminator [Marinibacterium profundimaris]|uniref:Transcription termination/antitermination protein NusG n=1 Tax=Marinibacterium profundimaris TaxID=1679460 RepID=A0A225NT40_9RHOB|nr:transcriptional antiterminator [Marinibacterium profundimaris]
MAQLKPNGARAAERNLRRQGFGTFLPLEERMIRSRGRFVSAERPVFPGYVFVSLDPAASVWRAVNSTFGVQRLVAFGRGPVPVPEGIVDGLITRCDGKGRLRPPGGLAPGQTVRLASGPFADTLAEIERLEPDRRVRLLMTMMGGQTRVTVGADQLRAV